MTNQERSWVLFIDLNTAGLPGTVSILGKDSDVGIVHVRTVLSAFQLLARADRRLSAVFVARRPYDPLAEKLFGEVRRIAPKADLFELDAGLDPGSEPSPYARRIRLQEIPNILKRYSLRTVGSAAG